MSDIETMDLKNAIKFYASAIVEDNINERIEVHSRICQLIGVSKTDFSPFEGFGLGCRIKSEKHAEQLIRKTINKIKGSNTVTE